MNSDNSGKYFSRGFTGWSAFHQDCHSKHPESSASSETHLKHAVTRSGRSDSKETVTILKRDDVYWRLTLYALNGTPAYIIPCRGKNSRPSGEKCRFSILSDAKRNDYFFGNLFADKDTALIFIRLRWLMAKRILLADDSPFWRQTGLRPYRNRGGCNPMP